MGGRHLYSAESSTDLCHDPSIHRWYVCQWKTLAALGISNVFSIANFKLQTTETPYGWTIYLDDAFTKNSRPQLKNHENYAMVILACTKNLGSVTFSYTLDGKRQILLIRKNREKMNFLAPVTTSAVLPQSFRHCLQNRHLKRSRLSRLSGNQGYRLTEQLNNVPDAEITGTIQNENKILLNNMKVICRPTAGRRDQSANHFLPKRCTRLYRIQKSAVICPSTESRQHFRQHNRG